MHGLCDALKGDGIDVQFEQNIVDKGHKASELLERTQSGEIDGCYFSSSHLAARAPNLGLFDQHFVIPSRRHAWALLDGAWQKKMMSCARKRCATRAVS